MNILSAFHSSKLVRNLLISHCTILRILIQSSIRRIRATKPITHTRVGFHRYSNSNPTRYDIRQAFLYFMLQGTQVTVATAKEKCLFRLVRENGQGASQADNAGRDRAAERQRKPCSRGMRPLDDLLLWIFLASKILVDFWLFVQSKFTIALCNAPQTENGEHVPR